MDEGFWKWWWTHAMDGVIGGVIGGAMTALAVVLTIRHERRISELQAVRMAASTFHAQSFRLLRELSDPDSEVPFALLMEQLTSELLVLATRSNAQWPGFSERLVVAVTKMHQAVFAAAVAEEQGDFKAEVVSAFHDARAAIVGWLSFEKKYEVSLRQRLTARLRAAWHSRAE